MAAVLATKEAKYLLWPQAILFCLNLEQSPSWLQQRVLALQPELCLQGMAFPCYQLRRWDPWSIQKGTSAWGKIFLAAADLIRILILWPGRSPLSHRKVICPSQPWCSHFQLTSVCCKQLTSWVQMPIGGERALVITSTLCSAPHYASCFHLKMEIINLTQTLAMVWSCDNIKLDFIL